METLLKKTKWTTEADFVIADIIEYDMKRAGLSIIKENNLLPQKEIEALEKKDKREADIEIGKLNYKIKGFSRTLEDYKTLYRVQFGQLNKLSNADIISVKSDAIFSKKYCDNKQITENILFREKNYYHALLKIGNIEMYWNEDTGKIDVKGISDDKVALHQNYLLRSLSDIISRMASYDTRMATRKLVKLIDDYKFRRLPIEYYREFNSECKYILYMEDNVGSVSDVGQSYIDRVVINYNYVNVLIPLLNIIT